MKLGRLFAFLVTDPDRVRCVLHPVRSDLVVEEQDADGWGIGFYQSDEILLQRRPKRPAGRVDFYAVAAALRTDALIGHVLAAGSPLEAKNENTHPFRYRSWLFAQHGRMPQSSSLRSRLLEAIPDFLRRNVRGQTDAEPFFYLLLAAMHETSRIDDPDISPRMAAAALARAVARLEQLEPAAGAQLTSVMTNGRLLLMHRRCGPAYALHVNGVHDCAVCRENLDPGRGIKHVDHEHLRGVILTTEPGHPLGAPWREIPDGHLLVVQRDLTTEVGPLPSV